MKRPHPAPVALRAAIVVLAASLSAACSASDSADSPVSAAEAKAYTKMLDSLYQGKVLEPPTTGPKAAGEGNDVWYIDCGQVFEGCAESAAGMKEAATELGWNFRLYDAKSDPSSAAAGIRQAIAAKADAIVLAAYNCAQLQGPLSESKAAGIPVVATNSPDCDNKLFTADLLMYKSKTYEDFLNYFHQFKAQYIIAKSQGKAKIIDIHEVSTPTQEAAHQVFLKEIETCGDCEIVADVPFTWATANQLQQKVSAAILAHPDATAINVPADTLIPGSVALPVKRAHREGELLVMGGEGFRANIQLIRDGVQTAGMAYSSTWQGWALADIVNRIFAEGPEATIPNQGGGFQAVDLDHNLPPEGEVYSPPIDFKKSYLTLWGLG